MRTKLATPALMAIVGAAALPVCPQVHAETLEEVLIIGVRENRVSEGATGLALDIQNTPQSISVVTRDLMDLYGTDSINDALDLATGISVERWETNRTNYVSRGFEIKSTQVDGVGLPNSWGLVEGATDAYGYEKIEVIRGANGLLTGIGNASGTLNYVRKRPTNSAQGEIGVSAASYDSFRVEADYSAPLTESGKWAGRLVMATESANSYIDGKSDDRTYLYGVIDGQLTENSTLTIGYSYQSANTDGNMWGGLVFVNADGSQAEWSRSATTSQDWTYWDNVNRSAFVEYSYRLPHDWGFKLSYNYQEMESDSELFFVYAPAGLDPNTAEGLDGWPGKWPSMNKAEIFEAQLGGSFDWLGQTHQMIVGVSHAGSKNDQFVHPFDYSEPAFGPLAVAFPYSLHAIPEPVWGAKQLDSETDDQLQRVYAATQLNFGDLALVMGVNAIEFDRDATSLTNTLSESEVSPYAGITYSLTDSINAYASYSDIYQPQDYYDSSGDYLAPTKGENYEIGLKTSWLSQGLFANVALFKAEQLGLGTYAGFNGATGQYFYNGEDIYSEGVELELSGQLNDYVQVLLGMTYVDVEDGDGEDTYGWVPQETVNFSVTGRLPEWENVSLGLSGRWQAKTERNDGYTGIEVKQADYALINGFVSWQLDANSTVKLNAYNLTNEKYITSLYEIGYYGAPRTYKVSYQYSF